MGFIAAIAVLLLYRRHLFGAARDKQSGAHRVIAVLIVGGLLCIAFMPEIWLVLPAFDAVGLDVATVLVLVELHHYLDGVLRPFVCLPALKANARRALLLSFDVPRTMRYAGTGAVALSWLAIGTSVALGCFRMHAG